MMAAENSRPYGFRRVLEAVKGEVTIERLADDLGASLKPHGDELRGTCPIHQGDNRTAFAVHPDTGKWFCFRCSEGGDVLDLFIRVHGYTDRKLALMDLAATHGVEGPGRPESWHEWDSEKARRRQMLRTALARAYQRRFFRLFSGYLASIADGEEREHEGRRFWNDLWPLAISCAEKRLQHG